MFPKWLLLTVSCAYALAMLNLIAHIARLLTTRRVLWSTDYEAEPDHCPCMR